MDFDTAVPAVEKSGMSGNADFKRGPRVRDPQLLRWLHQRWRFCALCGATDPLSLHHILKHPRDDVMSNLVMLCGDGVRGCHGLVEAQDGPTLQRLVKYILAVRSDTVFYLREQLGKEAADEWIEYRMS